MLNRHARPSKQIVKTNVASLALLILLTGCQTPVVSNPDESPGENARGEFSGLATLLNGKNRAVIVFIHGVGDHCAGFALDDNDGWLNRDVQKAIRLTPVNDAPATTHTIDVSEFVPHHAQDSPSKMVWSTRDYTLVLNASGSSGQGSVPVRAIEITWSQLTQWIKSQQLNYDLTKATDPPKPSDPQDGCPYKDSAQYKPPLAREIINRTIKEDVLDRKLSDAILYAGVYGRVIRRGIAESLCRAVGGTKQTDGNLCKWPNETASDTEYFFVTHSLGSSMLYHVLLGLQGQDVTNTAGTFSASEITDGTRFVYYLVGNTGAAYLMANQLPMVGLAYEDPNRTSNEGSYDPRAFTNVATSSTTLIAPIVPLSQIHQKITNEPLPFIAFSDQNDLLSWGIPRWYVQSGVKNFTNVYLKDSTHYPPVYADASGAHDNYFKNEDVWRAIRCGATNGRIVRCP